MMKKTVVSSSAGLMSGSWTEAAMRRGPAPSTLAAS